MSSNASSDPTPGSSMDYYGEYWRIFRDNYTAVHGYLSLIVCVFGISANLVNTVVLTRKNMTSPTNAILTGLAVADTLVMFSYLPFAIHNYIRTDLPVTDKYSYGWAVFTLFHAHFTVVFHTVSIWLTVTVAIWRYMAVGCPASNLNWGSMARAKYAIFGTYVGCVVFCLPIYWTFTVRETAEDRLLVYKVDFSPVAKENNGLLRKLNFWIFGVATKLVPCLALTGLSRGLIRVLYQADARKRRLKNRVESDRSCDRTTRMLLAVLWLFLLTEFPSGILALLSGILGESFFHRVYSNFGEAMDILALINSAINFIVYCSMSRQFRDTFVQLFTPKILSRWKSSPTEPNSTYATTFV